MEENLNEQIPVTQPEQPVNAAPKNSALKIVLITVFCCLLLVVMVAVVLVGSGMITFNSGAQNTTTEPTTTESSLQEPTDYKSYTVDAETANAKAAEVVATVGDMQLTNGELQVYYWMGIYEFISSNSYWLSYMGVDFSQPLDQQLYNPETGETWQEAMLDYALTTWHQYTAVGLHAEETGFVLDDEGQSYLQNLDTDIASQMTQYGYTSLEEMLAKEMGPGASAQGYKNYLSAGYYAIQYVTDMQDSIDPALEDLEAYFAEHETEYTANGVTKDAGNVIDVRHVLIMPEGGTTDENNVTTYSEDEWEACRVKAQQLLDDWKAADGDEISFAVMAQEHSKDSGSAANGGLYTDVTEGYMVDEFNDWIFDESRLYGDTDLVKTQFGYHIMFFVKSEPAWLSTARSDYQADRINTMIEGALEKWPLVTNYDAIVLGNAANA